MKYHAKLKYADTFHFWYNYSKEGIIDTIVIPFINGQVVQITNGNNKAILNLKSATAVKIYKTKSSLKITEDGISIASQISERDFDNDYNCTEEILTEVNQNILAPNKSDLERKFSTVKNQVFVIMKFGDKELDSAYEGVMEPIIEDFSLTPIRVDKIKDSGKITDQIIESIASSRYILADLSGERPNTYYEAGFAHALGKEIIFTIRKGEKIHFDLAGHRFIQWETEAELRNQLRERFGSLTSEGDA